MRHAYGNANVKPDGNPYANINTNSDSYGSCHGYTYSDGYSLRHTVTHADLRTRRHTWAVGDRPARATRSLSRWWMHQWNKYLRLRRWQFQWRLLQRPLALESGYPNLDATGQHADSQAEYSRRLLEW